MKKSIIAPVLVGIFLLVAAALWAWTVSSIDYKQMRGGRAAPQEQTERPDTE